MKTIDLLITPRWLLPVAPKNIILENHSLAIQDGKILDLLPTPEARIKYSPKIHRELKTHALLPGFINAHAHTPMNLFRGLADDLPLMKWLKEAIWPAETRILNKETVEVGTRLAIAEMLRGGITCFNDHYLYYPITAQTTIEEGMRACIGLWILDAPNAWSKNAEQALSLAKEAVENKNASPLITFSLAPHAPYTISDSTFLKIKELSAQYNIPIHIHLHETESEIEISLSEYNMRPLQRLDQLGLLSSHLIAVHMVHLTEKEIERLAQTKTHVVHCPESNLKLSSGFAPIHQLRQANINVALGTDGAASNNDLDLIGEMKTAAFIAKAVTGNPTVLPAGTVIEMATINGAKALGLETMIGSLEINKMADVIAIDLSHFTTQPVYNALSQIVYASSRLQVSDVWVGGKALLQNTQFVHLDLEKTLSALRHWEEKIKPFAKL